MSYIRKSLAVFMVAVLILAGTGSSEAEAKAKIALNRTKVTLNVGSKKTLKLKNYSKRVSWSSSKKSVASVSSRGVVTAKKAGSAKITAKAGGKKYVCRVTVKAASNKNRSYAKKVLELVNKERTKAGLGTMVLDDSLCNVANIRAKEITEVFEHTRPNGSSCFTVLKENNISYRAVGENIAAGQSTPEEVMKGWMNSPGHRANILSEDFNKLGVGYVTAGDAYGHYWVQIFSD